jgi:glycosyltransferase involved in cell wall biosynthesis
LYAPGGFDHRKNIDRLFEAYAQLDVEVRAQHQLVIASSLEPGRREILNQSMAKHGLTANEILLTDYVSDEALMHLYSSCFAYVFPSLHEGFGLPALEAMACGAPVIASNCTSIPEVVGMDEALFDPYDSKSIAEKLLQLHTDENYRERLVAHSKTRPSLFSWEYSGRIAAAAIIEKNQQLVADGWKVTRKSALPSCDDLLKRIQLLVPSIHPSDEDSKVFRMCYESNQRLI